MTERVITEEKALRLMGGSQDALERIRHTIEDVKTREGLLTFRNGQYLLLESEASPTR